MITNYLFEYQRLVSLRRQSAHGPVASRGLIATGLTLVVTASWLGHCSLSGCPMFNS